MITLSSIHKRFNNNHVLNDINLEICNNTITTIVGPNGMGKSTLLNILSGILYPDSGNIEFSPPIISNNEIFAITSTSNFLYAKNTVEENVIYLAVLRGLSNKQIKENVQIYKKYFPLYDSLKYKLFEELSSGQKKLAIIFTSLVINAQYLILDEPTEGLDLEHKKQLASVLTSIKRQKTIIITSHDADFVSSLTDQFIFLKDGVVAFRSNALSVTSFLQNYNSLYKGD